MTVVGVVEKEGEKGGRFAPPNTFPALGGNEGGREGGERKQGRERNPLLWVDVPAIEKWVVEEGGKEGEREGRGVMHYLIQLQEDTKGVEATTSQAGTEEGKLSSPPSLPPSPEWPVAKSVSDVGDFYVTPATHLVYALTWFSLAGAGAVMTKRILRPPRG